VRLIDRNSDSTNGQASARGQLIAVNPWRIDYIKRSSSSRSGWRDYAILHLMAFYGLRPSEIASLQLGSIDWNAGILKVEQRKTRSTLTLPLTGRTVGILHR
jgi:integrase